MPSRKKKQLPFLPRLIGGLLLLALLALLLGFLFVDYRAALALAAGVGAAWLIVRIAGRLGGGRPRRRIGIAVGGVLVVVALAAAVVFLPRLANDAAAPRTFPTMAPMGAAGEEAEAPREAAITEYRLTARPEDSLAAGVVVNEEVVFDVYDGGEITFAGEGMQFPERHVTSERRGFLLREVTIEPLGAGVFEPVRLTLPDTSVELARLCSARSCPPAHVRLEDFPQNTFFAARGVQTVEIVPYVNTEIVTWTVDDVALLTEGVTFAYIPPPFQHLRPVLAPLVGAARVSEWLVGLVGLVGSIAVAPVLMPVLENVVIDRLFDAFKGAVGLGEERKRSPRR